MNAIQKPAAKGNYGVGRSQRISRITFHHIVGDASGAIARFQTPGVQVSATYVIGSDGTLYQCVSENNTPYTDGNSDSNSRSITIEHAGGIPSVPYTDAMYNTSIALVRDLIARYGITDFKKHSEVIDKNVYPGGTACPGGLDVGRIINGAIGEEMDLVNDRGDAINFIRNSRGDNTYNPSEEEITNAQEQTYKDWAYVLMSLNEGDAVNFLNAQGLKVTDENKALMQAEGFKHWAYDFSGKMNGASLPAGTYIKIDNSSIIEVK